ncbi:hypothetical protein ACWIJ6_11595 [Aeromonas piscicola]
MGKHTQEPWKLYRNDQSVGDARGYAVCDVWPRGDDGMASEEGKANARRIVACVNACEGIDTDLLEKATSMRLDLNLVKKPGMVEILQKASKAINEAASKMQAFDESLQQASRYINQALAKAKGGAA